MAESESASNGFDPLGIKPVSRALEKVTDAAIKGAEAILGRICSPAAEEIGLLLHDRISNWRTRQLISMTKKLETKLRENSVPAANRAHPRLVCSIMEQTSWTDDSTVQDLWAGLLASSCTQAGDDDSNLIFTDLLSGLTRLQARVLKYACENAKKTSVGRGLIQAKRLTVTFEKLCEIAQDNDLQRLDRELDRLRGMALLDIGSGGFYTGDQGYADLTPMPLALHMYVRCSGSRASPVEFFNVPPEPAPA